MSSPAAWLSKNARFGAAMSVVSLILLILSNVAIAGPTTPQDRVARISYTERVDLEARLPVSHPVFCANSLAEWAELTAGFGVGVAGYTWVDPDNGWLFRTIWLSPATCRGLAFTDQRTFADSAETLIHEWFHAQFLTRDEGETECLALYVYRYWLRHWWGMKPKIAQANYTVAFEAHVKLGRMFPAYMGDCTYPQYDPIP